VKPVDFQLHRPSSLPQAVALLERLGDDCKLLAGGQSLVPLLNFRLARPEHVIDLSGIGSLATVRRTRDQLVIGAMTTHAQAERSRAIARAAPLITQALPHVAHSAIRARGTVGGSIAHGDPAAELPAVVLALDATVVAVGPAGERVIAAADFFRGNLVTSLGPDEVLTEIRIRPAPASVGVAFEEVGRRQGDFALVGAGAQVQLDARGRVAELRTCLTGVSPAPRRATEAESMLTGRALSPEAVEAAAAATREALSPNSDLHATAEYRRDVAGTLLARVVRSAEQRARAAAEAAPTEEGPQ
jgi:aerobic carbon-monoxide dehydrogenase medium subunit